jgi:predicted transcriptional regulator
MSKSLTVRISGKLEKELESLSREEKTPVSDLVRDSLERFLAVRKFRSLRAQILPFAESQGLLTDEDIFKIVS